MTEQPHVYVACSFPPQVLALFKEQFGADSNDTGDVLHTQDLLRNAQGRNVLVVTATDRLDQRTIAQLPDSIRLIANYSVGTDHIDLPALKARGIALLTTPGVLDESCADAAWLLMLGAARRAIESLALIREGTWQGWRPGQLIGRDVWGSRLGIFGMGRIGRAIARRAAGFDMAVHYHNRSRLEPALEGQAQYHDSLESLAESSEFLVIACPSTPQTRHSVNAQILKRLPPQAVVCNISRGDIVVDQDLVDALQDGTIAAAGLDVYDGEPDIHPAYRQLPNVFGLPHIGSSTLNTRLAMAALLCRGITQFFEGGQPENAVC